MRLLADENVPRPIIVALRAAGQDVESAIEIAPETEVHVWLDRAWIVLTSDRDFGERVVHHFDRRAVSSF